MTSASAGTSARPARTESLLVAPPEVAEIRFALLDEVRKKSYPSGGKRVFPYNFVHIHVKGVEDSRARIFKGDFFKRYFEQEIRKALVKAECKYPEDLEVEVSVTDELPNRARSFSRPRRTRQRR